MKILFTTLSICTVLFITASDPTFSQTKKNGSKEDAFYKQVKNSLKLDYNFKDSVLVYAFNFKLEVVGNDKGKSKIINIIANDSLAYKMFPNYKGLYNADCTFINSRMGKFSIVIPILVFYKNHLDDPKIDMNAALNAAQSLYSTKQYNNERDSGQPFGYLFNANLQRYNGVSKPENVIFLPLRCVEILNLPRSKSETNQRR